MLKRLKLSDGTSLPVFAHNTPLPFPSLITLLAKLSGMKLPASKLLEPPGKKITPQYVEKRDDEN